MESLRKCKFDPLFFSSKSCFLDQSRICEVSPTRDSEFLQILFCTQINDKEKYFVVSFEPVKSTGSPKWDLTPQNIWLSDSIPETALLKFKANNGNFLDFLFQQLDAENVLKQSKLHFTGTNFIFANPYHMDPMTSCHWQRYLNQATRPYKLLIGSEFYDNKWSRELQSLKATTCMVCALTGIVFSTVNFFIPGNFRRVFM